MKLLALILCPGNHDEKADLFFDIVMGKKGQMQIQRDTEIKLKHKSAKKEELNIYSD